MDRIHCQIDECWSWLGEQLETECLLVVVAGGAARFDHLCLGIITPPTTAPATEAFSTLSKTSSRLKM